MKVLIVTGDGDFGALSFAAKYKGRKVADLLQELDFENGEDIDNEEVSYELKEFDIPLNAEIDTFIKFLKNKFCDYDHLKAQDFFLENETIQY